MGLITGLYQRQKVELERGTISRAGRPESLFVQVPTRRSELGLGSSLRGPEGPTENGRRGSAGRGPSCRSGARYSWQICHELNFIRVSLVKLSLFSRARFSSFYVQMWRAHLTPSKTLCPQGTPPP